MTGYCNKLYLKKLLLIKIFVKFNIIFKDILNFTNIY